MHGRPQDCGCPINITRMSSLAQTLTQPWHKSYSNSNPYPNLSLRTIPRIDTYWYNERYVCVEGLRIVVVQETLQEWQASHKP